MKIAGGGALKKTSVSPKKLLFEGWSPLAVKRQKRKKTRTDL